MKILKAVGAAAVVDSMDMELDIAKFEVSVTPFPFAYQATLKNNLKKYQIHTEKILFTCCGQDFTEKYKLKEHLQLCGYFRDIKQIKKEIHTKKILFTCCRQDFTEKYRLKEHLKLCGRFTKKEIHTKKILFTCCRQDFTEKYKLKEHVKLCGRFTSFFQKSICNQNYIKNDRMFESLKEDGKYVAKPVDLKDKDKEKNIAPNLKKQSRSLTKAEQHKIELEIKTTKNDLTPYLQKKRDTVDLKPIKLPEIYRNEIATIPSNKNNSRDELSILKSHPRTLKERQNNENILRNFNENHSDDMFVSINHPSYFSKLNLIENSFSSDSEDEENNFNDHNWTNRSPITKHVPNFIGWSPTTPEHIRGEDETTSRSSQLAFVNKALFERKKPKKSLRKGILQGKENLKNGRRHLGDFVNKSVESYFPKKKNQWVLHRFLSDLEPALIDINKSQEDIYDSAEEMEPYFEDDL